MATQDTVSELRARIAELEERIRKMEQRDEYGVERLMRKLLPDDARSHLRAARKEQLLAARSMLDHWIKRAESASSEAPRRRESIRVE